LFNDIVFKRVGFRSVFVRDGLRNQLEISLSLRDVLYCFVPSPFTVILKIVSLFHLDTITVIL
jgi:hypothetical protein